MKIVRNGQEQSFTPVSKLEIAALMLMQGQVVDGAKLPGGFIVPRAPYGFEYVVIDGEIVRRVKPGVRQPAFAGR